MPYGWSDFATIYYLNELVRRHLYAFNYNNNPNVTREETARNIVRDASKFTVEKAKAIPQEVLNDFIEAWKDIFNVMSVKGSNDSTELFRNCKETDDSALNKLLKNYRELSHKINGCPFAHVIDEAITLMEKWTTIREDLKFFQTIIDARDEASKLFDRCKSINTFYGDQFSRYQQIISFIDENRDNFSFLLDDQQEALRSLRAVTTDEEPWERMPSYTKLQKTINGKLQEKKKELIQIITDKFNAVFDDLEQYAESVNVSRDKFAKRDVTISLRTNTNNFYALQANASTKEFQEEQMRKINDAKPTSGGRKRILVNLSTHTTQPIRSEADIDSYLQGLKAELMQHLGDNIDIIIN